MSEIEIMKIYENIVGERPKEKIKAVPLWIYLGIVFLDQKKSVKMPYPKAHMIWSTLYGLYNISYIFP